MTNTPPRLTKDRRPPMFPAPDFPPRKPKLFARTPPAIFPSLLGLLGLGLALRQGWAVLGLEGSVVAGLAEAALGGVLIVWFLAVVALKAKVLRRFGTLSEDMRVLPGRSGLAAASMSGMAAAAVLVPYGPKLALFLAVASLVAHLVMAVLLVDTLRKLPSEARGVNPALHLAFVGFILAAVPLAQLGYVEAARLLFWATLPIAGLIWGVSLVQLIRTVPPAPLRPLLAIHLAPAALFSTVAGLVGFPLLSIGFAVLGAAIFLGLLGGIKWVVATGFSPLWGAFTFPMAAFATALLSLGGIWDLPGIVVLIFAIGVIPAIAWNVLKLWPANRLAIKTNAAEA